MSSEFDNIFRWVLIIVWKIPVARYRSPNKCLSFIEYIPFVLLATALVWYFCLYKET